MNTEEKSLVRVNEDSLLSKIKRFIKGLFLRNKTIENIQEKNNLNIVEENKKESFMNYIKNIEDDETRIIKLQQQYRTGKVKEEELSAEQISKLCLLYDRQINNLRKANEIKVQKLVEYSRKLQTDN